MNQTEATQITLEVINSNNVALIGTVNKKGNPNIKALTKLKNNGITRFYFSTQVNSVKVEQMKHHKEGCIYFFDVMQHIGVLLEGEFNIIEGVAEGIAEIYQAMGADKFNLCTVEFVTKTVNLYKDFQTTIFDIYN